MNVLSVALAVVLTGFSPVAAFQQPRAMGISRPAAPSSTTELFARKSFISGNWKLNPQTRDEAVTLAKEISDSVSDSSPDADRALFVPYPFIEAAMSAVGPGVFIGAEACVPETAGAYTGAVSTPMLKSLGVQWVLAGHSERRVIYQESDEYINSQCRQIIADGMSVMLCIGESEDEYDKNLAGAVCAVQLKKGLDGISKDDMSRVAIAYEPVWAIGTGKVATPETAQNVHATCRAILAEIYDDETADATRILYGGSVSPESVDELMAQPDIDGGLVGGASLDSSKFARIINYEVPVAV